LSTYYILTGGAGFIGSNVLKAMNQRGIANIVIVDNLQRADKFKNLVGCEFADYLDKRDFLDRLGAGEFDGAVEGVLHQGACSDTMESDGRYMMENNYRYSLALMDFCQDEEIPFIYASSAAVYGGGTVFREEPAYEGPLNVYGYSKYLFDQVVRRRFTDASAQIAGFRYFNVYGVNEAHKARMASVAWHLFNQYRDTGKVRLFEGSGGYAHGEQRRDFVSVEDVVKVNMFFLEHPEVSGIYNVGSGRAQPFNDVALATVNALRRSARQPELTLNEMLAQGILEYIPFPDALKGKYQHFTEADIGALREAGYDGSFLDVGAGVGRYIDELLRRGG
jgi:ADP-L-glycero-D-manno-heptose 6-epimerase